MASASPDESVRFVGENHPSEDPSEATSRMAGSQYVGPGWLEEEPASDGGRLPSSDR
ncbi:UNVERIFIED_CONTAM: hypothetical protein Slati_2194200 [Sesamum latifolium]|uniref:Uncharacterized protein n=1 Tax=Sesamum latifolium TaxID=2727402 RepID=A0AAW2WST1_9LAMI